jgi:hypothetical protein
MPLNFLIDHLQKPHEKFMKSYNKNNILLDILPNLRHQISLWRRYGKRGQIYLLHKAPVGFARQALFYHCRFSLHCPSGKP